MIVGEGKAGPGACARNAALQPGPRRAPPAPRPHPAPPGRPPPNPAPSRRQDRNHEGARPRGGDGQGRHPRARRGARAAAVLHLGARRHRRRAEPHGQPLHLQRAPQAVRLPAPRGRRRRGVGGGRGCSGPRPSRRRASPCWRRAPPGPRHSHPAPPIAVHKPQAGRGASLPAASCGPRWPAPPHFVASPDPTPLHATLRPPPRSIQGLRAEADGKSLLLLDELGTGTDPREGAALGVALLRRLVRGGVGAGALTVATTHHSLMTKLKFEDPRWAARALGGCRGPWGLQRGAIGQRRGAGAGACASPWLVAVREAPAW
jgi:hypothetical protein